MNRPLLLAVARHEGNMLVLQSGEVEVVLEGGEVGLAEQVLELCDGTRMSEDILSQWPDERGDILSLFETLEQMGVMVDCTQVYRFFHRSSANDNNSFYELRTDDEVAAIMSEPRWKPKAFGQALEAVNMDLKLNDLLTQRSSAFPGDSANPLSFDSLSGIINAMYSPTESGHWTVPSGGALYPLVIHVGVYGHIQGIAKGLWWYEPETRQFKLVSEAKQDVSHVMLGAQPSDELLEEGQAVIFISADLERSARKYSNRAYRYALLEAGAAMQNGALASAELGVKIRPIGGFLDSETQEFLELSGDVLPILTIITGG